MDLNRKSEGEYGSRTIEGATKALPDRTSTPTFSDSSHEEDEFQPKLGLLKDRTERLIDDTEGVDYQSSPVTKACRVSVRSRMQEALLSAEGFVSAMEEAADPSKHTINHLRCSLAILRAEQYLNMIELAMENPPRDELDRQLMKVMQSDPLASVRQELADDFCFSISPWVSSFLAFDLPAGKIVRTNVDDLPLSVKVEPMLEFSSIDLLEDKPVQVKACNVTIEKCKHTQRQFSTGSGMIGECLLQVCLTPISETSGTGGVPIWGQDEDMPTLAIREARAVQHNAYPPKPKGNVDIYTSYHFGSSSVTVNLIMKTFTTARNEVPELDVELFLALSGP